MRAEPADGKVFSINCYGLYELPRILRFGRYDNVDPRINSRNFRLFTHLPQTDIVLLIDPEELDFCTGREVIDAIVQKKLWPPSYEDALYFGANYQEIQTERDIVFPHLQMPIYGHIIVLGSKNGERNIRLVPFDGPYPESCVIAAARKPPGIQKR